MVHAVRCGFVRTLRLPQVESLLTGSLRRSPGIIPPRDSYVHLGNGAMIATRLWTMAMA